MNVLKYIFNLVMVWWDGHIHLSAVNKLVQTFWRALKIFFWELQRSSCLWPHSSLPRNIFCGFSKNFKATHTKRFLYQYSRIFLLRKILYQHRENITTNLYVPLFQLQQLVRFSRSCFIYFCSISVPGFLSFSFSRSILKWIQEILFSL